LRARPPTPSIPLGGFLSHQLGMGRRAIAVASLGLFGAADALAAVGGMLRTRPNLYCMSATEDPDATRDNAPMATGSGGSGKGFNVESLAGISAPLGFFDPAGFCKDASEGKIRFYREVELKHGRVAMLASVGFVVAESFHPFFGGGIDVPSFIAFQETPLQTFWSAVVMVIAIPEVFSVFSFNSPFGGEPWSIRSDYDPGDLGFDPLSLKPEDPEKLKIMQTKELNNGRLAMIGIAGMIGQELVTGSKLF